MTPRLPDREAWLQVPPDEIRWGTFTDVYGFEYRPGFAFRCGVCETADCVPLAGQAERLAKRHQVKEHRAARVVEMPFTDRSVAVALATARPDLARG